MYETQYVILATIGSVSLLFALGLYEWHHQSDLFGLIGMLSWGILTFASENLVVVTQSGSEVTQSSPSMQFLSAGLALVSLFIVYSAWFKNWPADDDTDRRRATS